MAKLSSAAKEAEVGGQTLEDNLVKRFLPGSSDLKLKEKILDTPKVDGKIRFNHIKEKIKYYESNAVITSAHLQGGRVATKPIKSQIIGLGL